MTWEVTWERVRSLLVYLLRSGDNRVYLLGYVVPLPPGPEYGLRHIKFIGIDRIIDYLGITSCVLPDMRKEIVFWPWFANNPSKFAVLIRKKEKNQKSLQRMKIISEHSPYPEEKKKRLESIFSGISPLLFLFMFIC